MEPLHCPECSAEMQPNDQTCPHCGKSVVPQHTPESAPGEDGAYLCYRHRKEVTRLRCGRCGRAICPTCAMIGPAGPRCPECGRNKIPVSPRAVAHEAKMSFRGLFAGPLRYVFVFLIIGFLFSAVQTCSALVINGSGPDQSVQPGDDEGYQEEP